MSHRMEQINQLIRQEVSPIIGTIRDKYLGMVTLISVETTPDLSQTTLWVSTMHKEQMKDKEIIGILKKHVSEIHQHLKNRLFIKKIPRVVFRIDRSHELVSRVNEIFDILDKGGNLPL